MVLGPIIPYGPTFFVIGAQKAGTSRLCTLLKRHPSIAIPIWEPYYFQSQCDMEKKSEWYLRHFEAAAHKPARGDNSTHYSMCGIYPGTARRVYEFNPAARIIYMVRHPLRRIESAWRQLLSVQEVNGFLGFEHTLRKTPILIDPSLYWKQLGEYRHYFPDNQIRVGFFEDFIADERAELRACLSFLGVDPSVNIHTEDDQGRNASTAKRQRLVTVDAVRVLPGYKRIKPFIPPNVKVLFTERITRPVSMTTNWTTKSLDWAMSQISDDSTALLQYAGRKENYWSMP